MCRSLQTASQVELLGSHTLRRSGTVVASGCVAKIALKVLTGLLKQLTLNTYFRVRSSQVPLEKEQALVNNKFILFLCHWIIKSV